MKFSDKFEAGFKVLLHLSLRLEWAKRPTHSFLTVNQLDSFGIQMTGME